MGNMFEHDDEIDVGTQLDSDAISVPDEETSNSFEDEHAAQKDKAADDEVSGEDDKDQYSKKVQKRIDKLTAKNYQTETELQAERRRRLELEAELEEHRNKSIDIEVTSLKEKKIALIDEGRLEEADEVDDRLLTLRTQKIMRENQQRQVQEQNQQPAQQSTIPEAQLSWLEKNDWFYNPAKQAEKQKADQTYIKLINEGFDPNDSDTYAELDRRLHGSDSKQTRTERPPAGIGPDRGSAVTESRSAKFSDSDAVKMRRWGLDPNNATQRAEYLKNKGTVAA